MQAGAARRILLRRERRPVVGDRFATPPVIQLRHPARTADPSVDFDLHVFDENGNLITEDISTAPNAYCAITPRWTGPFRLVVDAARGMSGYRIVVME